MGFSRNKIDVLVVDCLEVVQAMGGRGFEHIAVLIMASKKSPGGGVEHGAGAQEEDLYRRTDAFRHTKQYF
jgi:uncharacterized protein (TIGR02452 family)